MVLVIVMGATLDNLCEPFGSQGSYSEHFCGASHGCHSGQFI